MAKRRKKRKRNKSSPAASQPSPPARQSTFAGFLDSSILGGIIALVAMAISLTGKLSVTGTTICLVLAWAIGVWAIFKNTVIKQLGPIARRMATIFGPIGWGLALFGLFVWLEPIRDLDTAELATTTKCQEAMIINKYKGAIFGKEAEPECPSYFSDFFELIARGVIQCNKRIASKHSQQI